MERRKIIALLTTAHTTECVCARARVCVCACVGARTSADKYNFKAEKKITLLKTFLLYRSATRTLRLGSEAWQFVGKVQTLRRNLSFHFQGGWWFFPKFGNLFAKLHGVASRKAVILMLATVRTSNITSIIQTFETISPPWVGTEAKYHRTTKITPDLVAQ